MAITGLTRVVRVRTHYSTVVSTVLYRVQYDSE